MKSKFPLFILLGFLSVPFFSLSDAVSSQTNTTSVAISKPAAKTSPVDSTAYYAKIIDSNHAFTQSRIRSFINRFFPKTKSDTSKAPVGIK